MTNQGINNKDSCQMGIQGAVQRIILLEVSILSNNDSKLITKKITKKIDKNGIIFDKKNYSIVKMM